MTRASVPPRLLALLAALWLALLGCGGRDQAGDERPAAADSGTAASPADTAAASAVRFVQGFYDAYLAADAPFTSTVRDRPQLFTPTLHRALLADLEATQRNPGEVVGLDWDPFLASQDPCVPYRTGASTRRGDTILVAVSGSCPTAARPGPDVVAEVVRAGGTWMFVDFRHGSDDGTLLGDLAQLRAERAADSAARADPAGTRPD